MNMLSNRLTKSQEVFIELSRVMPVSYILKQAEIDNKEIDRILNGTLPVEAFLRLLEIKAKVDAEEEPYQELKIKLYELETEIALQSGHYSSASDAWSEVQYAD